MKKIFVDRIVWQLSKNSVNLSCGRSKCLLNVFHAMLFTTQFKFVQLGLFIYITILHCAYKILLQKMGVHNTTGANTLFIYLAILLAMAVYIVYVRKVGKGNGTGLIRKGA